MIAWFQAHSNQLTTIFGLIAAFLASPDVKAELEKLLGVDEEVPFTPIPISTVPTTKPPLKALIMNPIALIRAKINHLIAAHGIDPSTIPADAMDQIHAAINKEATEAGVAVGGGFTGLLALIQFLMANSDKIKEIIDAVIALFPAKPVVSA